MRRLISVAVLALLVSSGPSFAVARTEPNGPKNHPGNFTGRIRPALFMLASVMLVAGFIAVYVLCYYMKPGAGTSSDPPLRVLQPLPGSAAGGINARVVETFPTFVYSDVKGLKIGKGALECAVCLSEFEDRDTLRLLPKCDHVFHTHCIGAWLGSHATCPVCRCDLMAEPAVERATQTKISGVESHTEPTVYIAPNQDNRDDTQGMLAAVTSVKLLRWNSTGHSLVRRGENADRVTLRIAEEIRKPMVVAPSQPTAEEEGSKRLNRFQMMSDRRLFLKTSSFH